MNPPLETLRSCPLFQQLPEPTLARLAERAEPRRFAAGDHLFFETQPGDEVFLLADGRVRIEIALANQDDSYEVAILGPGEIMGEICLIRPTNRSATGTAETDVSVLVWQGRELRAMCEADHHLGYHLMLEVAKIMWDRLVKLNNRVLDSVSWGLD